MALYPGKTEHLYITTFIEPYPGYAVAIPHPTEIGMYVRKNFFGTGKQKTYLKKAIIWRDNKHLELYGRFPPERIFHRKQANSTTATPGVNEVIKRVKKVRTDGTVTVYEVPCIIATISTIPGRDYKQAKGARSKVLSIQKYGREEAMRLAIAWRQEMEEKLQYVDPSLTEVPEGFSPSLKSSQ